MDFGILMEQYYVIGPSSYRNRPFFSLPIFHLEQDSSVLELNQTTYKKYYIKENLDEIFTLWK